MYRVIGCITEQHDYRLVILAAFICIITALTSFSIYLRVTHARSSMRAMWLLITGVCAASGIWATHFVAMLAYEDNIPTTYELSVTVGSLLIAIVATTVGFTVSSLGSRAHALFGGGIVGIGISLMHFTGMQALIVAGHVEWDWTLVVFAVALGAALGAASMIAFRAFEGNRGIVTGAIVLTLAICSMHFTAMAAAIIVPDPTIDTSGGFSADVNAMALAVAGVDFCSSFSANS